LRNVFSDILLDFLLREFTDGSKGFEHDDDAVQNKNTLELIDVIKIYLTRNILIIRAWGGGGGE